MAKQNQNVARNTDESTPPISISPPHHHPPEETTRQPFCSVLNTVVDYAMHPPSPLEPEEFQETRAACASSKPILVPVLRVFGPIVRREKDNHHHHPLLVPHQSACLQIHGAFPYLLARPRVAGTAGGPLAPSDLPRRDEESIMMMSLRSEDRIDWDDKDSVETAVSVIQDALEEAIQSSMQEFGKTGNEEKESPTNPLNPRVIRRVSVVLGRGFYTYSPGPPAPFLRVEYYDPQQRWRIKRQLEKGIVLDHSFHPDPRQYDPTLLVRKNSQQDTDADSSVPDTLTFYCYEAHIPPTMQFFKDYNLSGMAYIHVASPLFRDPVPATRRNHFRPVVTQPVDPGHLLLRDNVPNEHRWTSHFPNFPVEKESTCDVELDICVDQIINIDDIMTEASSEEEENEEIHWRAVPSLREIWKDERRRMRQILAPAHNFLSSQYDGVKPRESSSGSQLACKGMNELLSDQQKQAYSRALRDIVKRHEVSIETINIALQERARKDQKPTPTSQEAVSALEALHEMFLGDSREDEGGPVDPTTSPQAHLFEVDLGVEGTKSNLTNLSIREEIELSQRIDRGESIYGSTVEIDPETLCPLDESDDEEDHDLHRLETELSTLATQALEYDADYIDGNTLSHKDVKPDGLLFGDSNSDIESETDSFHYSPRARYSLSVSESSIPLTNIEGSPAGESHPNPSAFSSPSYHASMVFSPSSLPPCRMAVNQGSALLPSTPNFRAPPWLSHVHEYSERYSFVRPIARKTHLDGGSFISPVELPPSTVSVAQWLRQDSGRGDSPHTPPKKRCKQEKSNQPTLVIDDNSRKIVASRDEEGVEEVEWQASQVDLSLTQNTGVLENNADQLNARYSQSSNPSDFIESLSDEPLEGMGNQGGRLHISKGGNLKTKVATQGTTPTPGGSREPKLARSIVLMSVEVHVQCRLGRVSQTDSRKIALTPDPGKDAIFAVCYVIARDPGGGETIQILEQGCIFVPSEKDFDGDDSENIVRFGDQLESAMPRRVLGIEAPFKAHCVRNEWLLLERLGSIIYMKDPDMMFSWDTQGSGIGYIIERGMAMGENDSVSRHCRKGLDMARLMSRTRRPNFSESTVYSDRGVGEDFGDIETRSKNRWKGSGLGGEWDERVGAGVAAASITGRLVFSAWKIVAEEVKHPNISYLPAAVSSVLGKRIPHHDNQKLNTWYAEGAGKERWRVIHYRLVQALSSILLFDALDVIGRSGEAARLCGVEFSQSFPGIRGSQYKVEGVLLRALKSLDSNQRGSRKGYVAKTQQSSSLFTHESRSQSQSPWKALRFRNRKSVTEEKSLSFEEGSYFFFSPSLDDTNNQEALEVQALTLEPESGHEVDPVVVCDFTALYPSLIIAYNLCFTTCAGKLEYHSTREEMRRSGRTTGKVGPFRYDESQSATVIQHHMKSLFGAQIKDDRAYVAPTGTIFLSEGVLKGVLPRVLDEILTTRAMLKKASKQYKSFGINTPPAVLRQLEAKQLALKYVANVTYGYTSATFSGRCAMPLLADTIVECARRTLSNAINLANSWGQDRDNKWYGCKVLYGDTDSCFVRLPGRSVQEAFTFGEEFCKAVTASNPPPVQLKLEKVYLGTLLQTKKKYCGMKFEARDQRKPVFEAKGIETVRRDQCALTQKVLRNALISLFKSGPTAVRSYLERQWSLILSGHVPVSDFILTGRVRSSYRGGRAGPVQAVLSRRLAEADPGRVVRHKERLSYVIVATPGRTFRLKDCVLTPTELLEQWDAYAVHANYYVTKHVNAALQRCLGLAPHYIDVAAWFAETPKPRRRLHFWPVTRSGSSAMIHSYFGSDICSLCGCRCRAHGRSKATICTDCRRKKATAIVKAEKMINDNQRDAQIASKRCRECNLCFEDAYTFARVESSSKTSSEVLVTPLANCTCTDCPITFQRHRLRETQFEAEALYKALTSSF